MPREDVHKVLLDAALRDTSEVAELGDKFLKGLYKGVVEPDKVLDRAHYGRSVKHHAENRALIDYYYLLSLYHYRRSDLYLAGVCLGRALHYIHDSSLEYREKAEHAYVEHEMRRLVKDGVNLQRICTPLLNSKHFTSAREVAREVVCKAYERSVDYLKKFVKELREPIDVKEIRKEYRRARLLKVTALLLLVTSLLASLLAFPYVIFMLERGLFLDFLLLSTPFPLLTSMASVMTLYKAGRLKIKHLILLSLASLIPILRFFVLLSLVLSIADYVPDAYIKAMKIGIARIRIKNFRTAY